MKKHFLLLSFFFVLRLSNIDSHHPIGCSCIHCNVLYTQWPHCCSSEWKYRNQIHPPSKLFLFWWAAEKMAIARQVRMLHIQPCTTDDETGRQTENQSPHTKYLIHFIFCFSLCLHSVIRYSSAAPFLHRVYRSSMFGCFLLCFIISFHLHLCSFPFWCIRVFRCLHSTSASLNKKNHNQRFLTKFFLLVFIYFFMAICGRWKLKV